MGLSTVLLLPPYYFKSKGEGLKKFIEEITSLCDINIWIYNNPLQTGIELSAEDMLSLSKSNAIIGFKDASPQLLELRKFVIMRDKSKKILGGLEEYGFYSLLLGSDGFTSSIGNFIPQLPLNICNRFNEGNLVEANRLNTILIDYRTFMLESNQPVMMHFAKIGLKKIGLIENTIVRPPLSNISEEQNKKIEKFIDQIFIQLPEFQKR
jgi:4-hydroxy-tetrahydrodipicolinate synthase